MLKLYFIERAEVSVIVWDSKWERYHPDKRTMQRISQFVFVADSFLVSLRESKSTSLYALKSLFIHCFDIKNNFRSNTCTEVVSFTPFVINDMKEQMRGSVNGIRTYLGGRKFLSGIICIIVWRKEYASPSSCYNAPVVNTRPYVRERGVETTEVHLNSSLSIFNAT